MADNANGGGPTQTKCRSQVHLLAFVGRIGSPQVREGTSFIL
jgi:hypothetical protein